MRIKTQDYFGLRFCAAHPGSGREHGIFLNEIAKPSYDHLRPQMRHHLFDAQRQHYLFTGTAHEIIDAIHCPPGFNFENLRGLPQRAITLLLSPSRMVRLHATEQAVYVLDIDHQRDFTMLSWSFVFGSGVEMEKGLKLRLWPELQKVVRTLIFLFFSKVETMELPANAPATVRHRMMNPTANESPVPLTQVTAHWNQYRTRLAPYGVKSHLRFQACGPRHTERKLVLVEAHERKGYSRAPRH